MILLQFLGGYTIINYTLPAPKENSSYKPGDSGDFQHVPGNPSEDPQVLSHKLTLQLWAKALVTLASWHGQCIERCHVIRF